MKLHVAQRVVEKLQEFEGNDRAEALDSLCDLIYVICTEAGEIDLPTSILKTSLETYLGGYEHLTEDDAD